MRVLRGISGKNRWIQWQDRISNADIRAELGVTSVGRKLDENVLRWFGHVSRMEAERLPRRMLYAKVPGHRPRGRPRVRWIDGVKSAVEERGKTFQEAANCREWKKFVKIK